MKYIVYTFLIYILSFSWVYGSDFITFRSSVEQLSIGENFLLEVVVNASEINLESVQFEIPGIENFDIFSQAHSESYNSINGQVERNITYALQLSAIREGEYILGPVRLLSVGSNITDDTAISIKVGDIPQVPPLDTALDGELSKDSVGDIRGLRIAERFGVFGIIGFILFCIVFYILLRELFRYKNRVSQYEGSPIEKDMTDTYSELQKYFKNLEKDIGSFSSQEFFQRYNTGLRKILVTHGFSQAESATLRELENFHGIKKEKSYQLLQKSYIHEYNHATVSQELQVGFIQDILITLK